MKMDPQIKADWTRALHSGQFTQAEGRLKNGDGFCCLGVLCLIAKPTIEALGWKVENYDSDDMMVFKDIGGHREYVACLDLPYLLAEQLNIKDVQSKLAAMNDGDGDNCPPKSFPEIADWIEENL